MKLDETSVQVGEMTIIAEEKQVVVAAAKVECESLLVTIIADKRVADDQEKQVSAEAAKIGRDAEDANQIAAECQAGLDLAMPALEAAQNALNVLTKKDMSELKAYSKPPALVELCLKGVMTVLKKSPTWDAAKKALGDSQVRVAFPKSLRLFTVEGRVHHGRNIDWQLLRLHTAHVHCFTEAGHGSDRLR